MKQLKINKILSEKKSSQGHDFALAVLSVPNSLDSDITTVETIAD